MTPSATSPAPSLVAAVVELERRAVRLLDDARAEADALRDEAARAYDRERAAAREALARRVADAEADARRALDAALDALRAEHADAVAELENTPPGAREAAAAFVLSRLEGGSA